MDDPYFTVVIPTHRRPDTLAPALESVMAQTLGGSQVIVVDDAGDAATRAVVEGFAGVQYLINDGVKGGSGARNAGVARARGRWVAFLDDDDVWLSNKLAAVRALIEAGAGDVGLVYSAAEHFDDETGAVLKVTRPTVRGDSLEAVLYSNVIGGMSVVVARKDHLDAVGGLDPAFPAMQDMELFVRLAQRAHFDFVPDVLVRVRSAHGGRISGDKTKKLVAAKMFASKFAHLVAKSPRLRHRTASRTLLYGVAAKDLTQVLRNLPWTLAGVVVDPGNMPYVLRGIARSLRPGTGSRPARAAVQP